MANSSSASGSFFALHLLDQHSERDLLPGTIARTGSERVVEREDLAGALAVELGVQLVAELTGADRVEVVGPGGLGDLLAVHGRVQVDDHVVALASGARHGLELGEPLAERVEVPVDLLVGDLDLRSIDLDALVLRRLELQARPDLDDRREHERLALLDVAELDIGFGDRREIVFAERLPVVGRAPTPR